MSQILVTGEAKIRDIQGPVVANSGVITALDGAASQYVRGDGTLADFPTSSGGGSSVSYYLNSSVSQGTIGGVAYRELSKEPIIGAGTDIAISANGYVASYLTDANDPDVILIPGGNFNCEFYFSVNNNTGNPFFYAELYKYDGTTFTLLGSSVGVPEYITQGTTIAPYYFAIPVATAALALTDRLAIRIYVNVAGRTVTLHTENGHLCQVVTTLSKGMVSLNNLTDQSQFITTGTSGTNFAIVSSGDTHTFNLPVASATNTGKLSSTDWSTFNGKVPYTGATASVDLGIYSLSGGDLQADGAGSVAGFLYLKQNTLISQYLADYSAIGAYSNGYVFNIATPSVSKQALLDLSSITASATRTYTLPDASGTLALTSNLSAYVPYTGATGAVNLGAFDLTVNGLKVGRGGGGISTNTVLGTTALNSNTTGSENTALGWNSLQNNTTGSSNTGIGAGSLYQNTTGSNNTALGYATLTANTTGTQNIAIGVGSLQNNTTANFNVAIGTSALSANITGAYNTAIGDSTLSTQTTANHNTAIGSSALTANTSGTPNTAVGRLSLATNTTGGSNTAIGYQSLYLNTTGGSNTAIGVGSLQNNTTANSNTAIGTSALQNNSTGSQNTAIGTSALSLNTTASNNTAIGFVALQQNTTGVNNTAIGSFSSYVNTTGQNNTSVGASTLIANTTGSQNTAIGSASLTQNTTGIGNTSIGYASLSVNTSGNYNVSLGGGNGNALTTGSSNILIGYNTGNGITTGSNNTIIGGGIFGLSATLSNNIILADGAGNIRYQWNGTNNVFGNPISGTSATFSSTISANGAGANIKLGGATTDGGLVVSASKFYIGDYATLTKGLVIDMSSGNVGIGTSSPAAYFGRTLTIDGATTQGLMFRDGGTDKAFIYQSSDFLTLGANVGGIIFKPADTERMRITSGGELLIAGTYNPYSSAGRGNITLNGSNNIIAFTNNSTPRGYIFHDNTDLEILNATSTGVIRLYTASTERMRITSGGNVGIGTSSPIRRLQVEHAAGIFAEVARFSNTSNRSADDFAMVTLLGANAANTSSYHYIAVTGAADRMYVYGNGNIVNSNNSYGTLSDITLKENIVDATPKLADILNLKVRNFNLIGDDTKQIGFIAQEFEEVFPSMVDLDGKSGKKAIKTSVLVPMLVKAIQELEARIKQLENK